MKKIGFVLILIILFAPATAYAKRGCCSHHGGVSGCSSSGRQICNDGTLSPTCTCTPRVTYIYGCMDKTARNYNSKANKNDGSCVYDVYGCMDKTARNYNSKANKNDGSCVYDIYGCMDKTARNYNSKANIDDGSCVYDIYGCMDKTARNYNSKANIDDGSCRFNDNYDSKKSVNYTSSKRDKLIAIGVIINIIYFFVYLFMKKDKI